MEKILIFSSCLGMNNKIDAARGRYDPEKGIIDLESSKDMLIDRSGGLSTRRGSVSVADGEFLSSYPAADGTSFYVVKNWSTSSTLEKCVPKADGSITMIGIRSGLTRGAKMSFCEVGGLTYYMNGFEFGVLDGNISSYWPVSEWPRESDSVSFRPVTAGNHLDMLAGRFIIAYGDQIAYTEHGLPGIINDAEGYEKIESAILMVYSVGTGVFVSDSKAVWFLEGTDPTQWKARLVLNYPAIPFCRMPGTVNPGDYGFEISTPSALFGTVRGPVVGFPDGSTENLIYKKVSTPSGCAAGSIMVVDETTIIQSGV